MTTRKDLQQRGDAIRNRIDATGSDAETAPGYQRMVSEALYGGIWARDVLPIEERYICVLSGLMLQQNEPQLRRHVRGALKIDLAPRSILEIFVQAGLYGGFPTAENAMNITHEVFAAEGVSVEAEADGDETLEEFSEMGGEMLVALHGDRGTKGYASPDNSTTGGLYTMAIQYGYGWLWHRAGLDRRQRMICAIASFTVLRLESQLRKFGQSALNVGLTKEEVVEVVMQTAPYGGFPPALNALAILDEVFS
jgi:alkylhydroperoxidase/carboxymuconolactone decarboxylase family protein YurZ